MIRVLALIAGVGFIVSVVCLSIAGALGGQDMAAHGWNFPHGWHVNVDDRDDRHFGGPDTTRQMAWDGSTRLEIDAPADVRYTQAPGPAKLEVTGPAGLLDRLTVSGGHIDYDGSSHHDHHLLIVMSAPNINSFELNSRGHLTIANYDQDRLDITMSGRSDVNAQGKARAITLAIAGRGDADLGQVVAEEAKVDISGAGQAVVAPKTSAELDISGSGDVTLLTHPTIVHSDISGSGRVIQTGPATTPTPPTPPAPAKK